MPRPSQKLATTAILVAMVAVAVLVALWWLRSDAGDAVARPGLETSASQQPSLTSPLSPDEEGSREAPRETAAVSVTDPETSPAAPDGPRVVVVVVDLDQQPVPGALVEVTGNGLLGTYTADAAGTCPLPLEPGSGNVELRVSADGFVPDCPRLGRAERIVVVLRRSADVRGRVVTAEEGSPVAGAHVTLQSFACREPAPKAVTDGTGRFELQGLPLERQILWYVRAEGFATRGREMELHDPSVEVELTLVRGVPLELEVVDAQIDAPIEGATIQHETTELVTDAQGRVETTALLSVEEEDALLVVRTPGYCSLFARIRASEVAPGVPVRLPLLAGARLESLVLDPGGGPVEGARVSLDLDVSGRWRAGETSRGLQEFIELPERWSVKGPRFEDATSDEAGRFGFDGLEPLSRWYRLRVHGQDGLPLADWQRVPPLGPPGSTTRLDIVLPARDTGVITGTMTLNGSPVRGGLGWRGPTRGGSALVDESGGFRAENIEPGRVTLRPQPEGLVAFSDCRDLFAGTWVVEVAPDDESRIDIALELEMAPIAGRVVDAAGTPQAGLRVVAFSRDGCWRDWMQTETDGTFELSVRAGPWGYSVDAGQYPDVAQREDVLAPTTGLELVLPGSGTLRLRIVDHQTHAPLSDFALHLEDEQGRSRILFDRIDSSFTPDPQGWYEHDLRPGLWQLFVGDYPGGDVSGYLPLDGGEVRIPAGDTPVTLELERERGLDLDVRLAQGQEPWPEDVFVLLLESDLCDQVELGSNGWQIGQGFRGLNVVDSRRVHPDSEGLARARALRSGKCSFVAFPDAIAIEPAEILVTGAETSPVELRWKPR